MGFEKYWQRFDAKTNCEDRSTDNWIELLRENAEMRLILLVWQISCIGAMLDDEDVLLYRSVSAWLPISIAA